MPPPVWIPAAAGLAGGLLQNNAQKNAAKEQRRSADQGIALERERMAREDRAAAAAAQSQRQWWEFQMDMRTEAARSAGYDVPDWRTRFGAPGPGGKAAAAQAAGKSSMPGAPSGNPVQGAARSLGNILGVTPHAAPEGLTPGPIAGGMAPGGMAQTQGMAGPAMSGGNTLGDIAGIDWSNWDRSLR